MIGVVELLQRLRGCLGAPRDLIDRTYMGRVHAVGGIPGVVEEVRRSMRVGLAEDAVPPNQALGRGQYVGDCPRATDITPHLSKPTQRMIQLGIISRVELRKKITVGVHVLRRRCGVGNAGRGGS
jgi:hypothetical protein